MEAQKKRIYLLTAVYLIGSVLGTVAALWMKGDLVEKVGIYQINFQESLSSVSINGWDYLVYIMRQRFWSMGLLMVFSLTVFAYPCLCAFSLYYGFCMAGMVVAATVSRGMMGVLFFFLSVMPHYILYAGAVLVMVDTVCCTHYLHRGQQVQGIVVAFILFMIGVFAEVYCNPVLMRGMAGIWN